MKVQGHQPRTSIPQPRQTLPAAPQGGGPPHDDFDWSDKVAAAGLTAVSKVGEAVWWTGLYARALADERELPLSEKAEMLGREQRAAEHQQRLRHCDPAPPLGVKSPLKDLPAARLQRPLVFVPGWYTSQDQFDTLTEKLAHGNGGAAYYLKEGQFYRDKHCEVPIAETQVPGDTKVFVTVHRLHNDSPEQTAPQLSQNLAAIARVTGQPRCDAVAFSQGGLAARNYLDSGGTGLGKLFMLGTPNRGSSLADMSLFMFEADEQGFGLDWLLAEKFLQDSDREALGWMATDSQKLQALNERWPQQRAALEDVMVMGSDRRRTLDSDWPYLVDGDAIVEAENLGLPGLEPVLVDDDPGRHNTLPFNAEVYLQMHDFFGWA